MARTTVSGPLDQMLGRIQGNITHQPLERPSPFSVPVLVQIGRERVAGGAAEMILSETAMDFAEETLIAEVMADAPPELEGAA